MKNFMRNTGLALLSAMMLSSCFDLKEEVYSEIPMDNFGKTEQELIATRPLLTPSSRTTAPSRACGRSRSRSRTSAPCPSTPTVRGPRSATASCSASSTPPRTPSCSRDGTSASTASPRATRFSTNWASRPPSSRPRRKSRPRSRCCAPSSTSWPSTAGQRSLFD